MFSHQPFHYHSLEDLAADIGRLGLDIPLTEDLSPLARPLECGPFRLPNRFVVLPMEGCDGAADGAPDELTFRRYRRFAAGGAALLWVEACAVVPEGRANPRQLWIHRGNMAAFARLLEEARRAAAETMGRSHRPVFVLQLTHSGRYSKPGRRPAPIIAHHSKYLDPVMGLPPDYPLISDGELERLEDVYVEAARALGASDRRIVWRHILPNSLSPVLVQASLAMAAAITAEATLSFLGLGTQPPTPSWGSMLNIAQAYLTRAPWMALWPGLAIFLTVLALNLVGDGLREVLDPRLR